MRRTEREIEREGVADLERCTHTALRKGDSPLSADDRAGGTRGARVNSLSVAVPFEAFAVG